MKAVKWKGFEGRKNLTFGFLLDLGEKKSGSLKIAGADLFKVYADGELVLYGPQRAARGTARLSEIGIFCKVLAIELESCYIKTYTFDKQTPFFACSLTLEDGTQFGTEDFSCYRLDDRVEKVQRFSYQRGFTEVYRMKHDRTAFYRGQSDYPAAETEEVPLPRLLEATVDNARLEIKEPVGIIECGRVEQDAGRSVWRERTHNDVGNGLEGYRIDEWEESATDEAVRFVYHAGEKATSGDLKYTIVDFGRSIAGLSELTVRARKPGTVYLIFDELLWEEHGRGKNFVACNRDTCSKVHKWTLEKAGVYRLEPFDVYALRYACIVSDAETEIESVRLRAYENPNAGRLRFHCANGKIDTVMEAARATIAQCTADSYICDPVRERTGWMGDAWFATVAEKIFTGDHQSERAYLENVLNSYSGEVPEGMVRPYCPGENYGDLFIPSWAMLYILLIVKHADIYGKDWIVEKSQEKVRGILKYFSERENELGLLENLGGWVIVDWSGANDPTHLCGVSVPTNMLYAYTLKEAGRAFEREEWSARGTRIGRTVKDIGYDGNFFVDNLVRDESGKLRQTGKLSEACQDYAFWTGVATPEEYPALFEEITENFGVLRKEGYKPNVCAAGLFLGTYMRLDLLVRKGDYRRVIAEAERIYYPMAARTGTLWEHMFIVPDERDCGLTLSISSYCARAIIAALTGYDCKDDKFISEETAGIDCEIELPCADGKGRRIAVRDGKRTTETFDC